MKKTIIILSVLTATIIGFLGCNVEDDPVENFKSCTCYFYGYGVDGEPSDTPGSQTSYPRKDVLAAGVKDCAEFEIYWTAYFSQYMPGKCSRVECKTDY